MARAATADVVVRSRKKGQKVYRDVQQQLDRLNAKAKQFGLIAGAAAIGGVALLTARSFQQVDVLAKHADRLGTSTEKLKTLQLLTELTGGSNENLSKSLLKAQKALGEFNITGSGTAAPFLRQMNFDTKELATLRPDELFQRYAEAIRGLGSRSEQTAAVAALFSDRTGELLNLIDLGADVFAETEAEVTKYGLALDRVDSAKVEAANDALLIAGERVAGVGNVIASKLAPFVTALANRFIDAGNEAAVMGDRIDSVVDGIAVGVGIVADGFFGWQLIFNAVRVEILQGSANIVAAFARVEQAGTFVNNAIREALGQQQLDPDQGPIRKIELSLAASAQHAREQLQHLTASEVPSVALGRAIAQIRVDSEAAAQASAKTREQLQAINAPTFDESEREVTEREREEKAAASLRNSLAAKLETVQSSILQEEQIEALAFLRRQEVVELSIQAELISEERGLQLKVELRQKFEDKITEISNKGLSERLKFQKLSGKAQAKDVFSTLESITAGVATSNKTLFRINQAAAIGNAIINTFEGVTKTMAKYPYPFNLVFAAAHLAAGLAQISAIRSASLGGGTTPSLAGSTPSFNDQPVTSDDSTQSNASAASIPATQITIIVEGSLIGDEGIKQILGDTLGELVDADEIFIAPESAQAAVIREGTGSGG